MILYEDYLDIFLDINNLSHAAAELLATGRSHTAAEVYTVWPRCAGDTAYVAGTEKPIAQIVIHRSSVYAASDIARAYKACGLLDNTIKDINAYTGGAILFSTDAYGKLRLSTCIAKLLRYNQEHPNDEVSIDYPMATGAIFQRAEGKEIFSKAIEIFKAENAGWSGV